MIGSGTTNEWNGTTEMNFNEETQAFECTVETVEGMLLFISHSLILSGLLLMKVGLISMLTTAMLLAKVTRMLPLTRL